MKSEGRASCNRTSVSIDVERENAIETQRPSGSKRSTCNCWKQRAGEVHAGAGVNARTGIHCGDGKESADVRLICTLAIPTQRDLSAKCNVETCCIGYDERRDPNCDRTIIHWLDNAVLQRLNIKGE